MKKLYCFLTVFLSSNVYSAHSDGVGNGLAAILDNRAPISGIYTREDSYLDGKNDEVNQIFDALLLVNTMIDTLKEQQARLGSLSSRGEREMGKVSDVRTFVAIQFRIKSLEKIKSNLMIKLEEIVK